MTTEWEANIQAIGKIFDRDRAEIASLKDQLIERLAEIDTKDAAIETQASLIGACRERIAELESIIDTLVAKVGKDWERIAELKETIRCMQPLRGLHI